MTEEDRELDFDLIKKHVERSSTPATVDPLTCSNLIFKFIFNKKKLKKKMPVYDFYGKRRLTNRVHLD